MATGILGGSLRDSGSGAAPGSAGKKHVLIETVGVGEDEIDIVGCGLLLVCCTGLAMIFKT